MIQRQPHPTPDVHISEGHTAYLAGLDTKVCDDLMSSDLPILSAEHYMDAADIRPARKAEKVKKGPPTRSEDGPRKRTKTSLRAIVTEVDDDDDAADADEKSKRARGRPRLDTQDQSAADVGS